MEYDKARGKLKREAIGEVRQSVQCFRTDGYYHTPLFWTHQAPRSIGTLLILSMK